MSQETISKAFDDVFQSVRNTAEANLKLQQELIRQWTSFWPGFPQAKSSPIEQIQKLQKQWADTVSSLAKKHRDVIDKQYEAAIVSLDEAMKVAQSKDPEEFRKSSQELFKKTMDCLRDISEAQIGEYQELVTKWGELATTAGK
jgi:gas vesicle protein